MALLVTWECTLSELALIHQLIAMDTFIHNTVYHVPICQSTGDEAVSWLSCEAGVG